MDNNLINALAIGLLIYAIWHFILADVKQKTILNTNTNANVNANTDEQPQDIEYPLHDQEIKKAECQPPDHYLLDTNRNWAQVNPRHYIVQDETGQTKIFKFNKDKIYDLDGQVMAYNGETVLGFPSTRQLIGHQYKPFDYVEQYSHPCHCYPRKRAIDGISGHHEYPRICNFCKCKQ